jgi:hypothetical protein
MNRRRFAALLAAASLVTRAAAAPPGPHTAPAGGKRPPADAARPRIIDWDDLLPVTERAKPLPAPVPVHDYLGEDGPPMRQTGSFAANRTLHGQRLRIPGFIVPLVAHPSPQVTEFFLVPYYGACIHVPPPPPNQLVHVMFARPRRIETIYDAYWVTGLMQVARKSTGLATAVYSMSGIALEVYH